MTKYGLIIKNPEHWDMEKEEDQYIYEIIRSHDNGITWHCVAIVSYSDSDLAKELVQILNYGSSVIEKTFKRITNMHVNDNPIDYIDDAYIDSFENQQQEWDDWDIHDD